MATSTWLSVDDAASALGVSRATVWRLIRSGRLTSARQHGRRWVRESSLARASRPAGRRSPIPLSPEHPMARMRGMARSGGAEPGSRDKHAILDC